MRKSVKFAIYYLVAFLVFTANIVFCIKDRFYYSIEDLPEGIYLYDASMSPSTKYTARAYKVTTPEGNGVRVAVTEIDSQTGEEVKTRNVYWKVDQSIVTLSWDEKKDILYVDSMMINVAGGESYDCREIATEK